MDHLVHFPASLRNICADLRPIAFESWRLLLTIGQSPGISARMGEFLLAREVEKSIHFSKMQKFVGKIPQK